MKKIANTVFPLASSVDRVALLLGCAAGAVQSQEIEAAVLHDTTPRKRRKAVVVLGVRYDSITAAARAQLDIKQTRWNKDVYYNAMLCEVKRIARMCTADRSGYYWSL